MNENLILKFRVAKKKTEQWKLLWLSSKSELSTQSIHLVLPVGTGQRPASWVVIFCFYLFSRKEKIHEFALCLLLTFKLNIRLMISMQCIRTPRSVCSMYLWWICSIPEFLHGIRREFDVKWSSRQFRQFLNYLSLSVWHSIHNNNSNQYGARERHDHFFTSVVSSLASCSTNESCTSQSDTQIIPDYDILPLNIPLSIPRTACSKCCIAYFDSLPLMRFSLQFNIRRGSTHSARPFFRPAVEFIHS